MRKAAESAAKWLADKVKGNSKLNPIPYPFFKSIVNKQVEWARTQRGITLDFEELAEAVRTELLRAGIYTMAESKKEAKTSHREPSLFDGSDQDTGGEIPPLSVKFQTAGEAVSMMMIFDWLRKVFDNALAQNYSGVCLTANRIQEDGHA